MPDTNTVTYDRAFIAFTGPTTLLTSLEVASSMNQDGTVVALWTLDGADAQSVTSDPLPTTAEEWTAWSNKTKAATPSDEHSIVIVIYGKRGEDSSLPFWDRIRSLWLNQDRGVLDILLVENGRYWSYLCEDADCCTEAGHPFPKPTTTE